MPNNERKKHGIVKTIRIIISILLVTCCLACHQQIVYPEDLPKASLDSALKALDAEDYDTYMSYVDYGRELDSLEHKNIVDVLRRHEEWKRAEREEIVSTEIVDVKMQGDTTCTIYYQYVFADSCRETVAQKMVMRDGRWKMRIRD